MRRLRMDYAGVALCLIAVGSVHAGVYNTDEPPLGPTATVGGVQPLPFSRFQATLADLRQLRVEQPESTLRKHYLERRNELQAKARAGRITDAERVNLSAYLIRLGQYDEAAEVLVPAAGREQRNFMVFANLATANQLAGHLSRAWDYLQQALDLWPREWPGLTTEQLTWYHEVEKYQRKLLRGRMQEARHQPAAGAMKQPDSVDPLFDVHFLGDGGRYEAGKLAADELKKLPADDLAIVQQLQLWMPDDTRLYWLYGELLNAHGDVDAAKKVLGECLWARRWTAPDLKAHHRVLAEAKPASGDALELTPAARNEPKPQPSAWPAAEKLIVVGGLAGLVVGALAYLQLRQVRRRRHRTTSARP